MSTFIGGILHEVWEGARAAFGGMPSGALVCVALLGTIVAALVWRLTTLVVRLAVRGLLIGVPVLALVTGASTLSAQPTPVSAKAALSLVQRGGAAALRATITTLAQAVSVDMQEAIAAETPLPSARPELASLAEQSDWVAVAHTDGDGVYLRATPRMADRLCAWGDGTALEVVGADTFGEGHRWKRVRDPSGQVGWVPAEFVTPLAAP